MIHDEVSSFTCVLRATTKKVVNFLREEKCTPRENIGYAYAVRVISRL